MTNIKKYIFIFLLIIIIILIPNLLISIIAIIGSLSTLFNSVILGGGNLGHSFDDYVSDSVSDNEIENMFKENEEAENVAAVNAYEDAVEEDYKEYDDDSEDATNKDTNSNNDILYSDEYEYNDEPIKINNSESKKVEDYKYDFIFIKKEPIKNDKFEINLDKKLLAIPLNTTFIVDGHNMIFSLSSNSSVKLNDIFKTLNVISDLLTSGLKYSIHIVLKNMKNINIKDYIKKITIVSKLYPSITYHIADDEDIDDPQHHMKGRDDFLTLYLSRIINNNYVISNDKFRDYKKFINIRPFTHYAIHHGEQSKPELIDPKQWFNSLNRPFIGNQIAYKIYYKDDAEKANITNGDIIASDRGYSILTLVSPYMRPSSKNPFIA